MSRGVLLALAVVAVVVCMAMATGPAKDRNHAGAVKAAAGKHKAAVTKHAADHTAKHGPKGAAHAAKHPKGVHKVKAPHKHKVKVPGVHEEKEHKFHHVHFIYHGHGSKPTAESIDSQTIINRQVAEAETVDHILSAQDGGLHSGDVMLPVLIAFGVPKEQAEHEDEAEVKKHTDKHFHDDSELIWFNPADNEPHKIGGADKKKSLIKLVQHIAQSVHYTLKAYVIHQGNKTKEITINELTLHVYDNDHEVVQKATANTAKVLGEHPHALEDESEENLYQHLDGATEIPSSDETLIGEENVEAGNAGMEI